MRVLVTGGAGFLGGCLVEAMLEDDVEVVVADHQCIASEKINSVVGDLRDPDVMAEAFSHSPDAVVHLAARTSVLRSVEEPQEVFTTNVDMTASLLEQCRLRRIDRFVFASTNAVVGVSASRIDETATLRPLTPYGATKAAAEMLISAYASSYGLAASSLRFTNIYGPGMAGKDSVVARMMRAALGQRTLEIYGDGKQMRDYLFVGDAVAATLLALNSSAAGTLIVGAGRSVSVNELHKLTCEATGVDIPVERVAKRQGEMAAVEVDTSRARSLGFAARTPLADGLNATWEYFRGLRASGRAHRYP